MSSIGKPPLVVGAFGSPVFPFSGFPVGVGEGVATGEAVGVAEALGVGEPNILVMKEVVDLKVIKPMIPIANMVRSPVMNDFICPILYITLSTIAVQRGWKL